ncbi:MAG: hypothetical protein CDV28_1576 [Candidatus Electronema aureum]|uniref:Uncharacterized protein n=1 Tax=Candidatus Electronema aureum TaxID=2005002 RepID=A0A521FYU8_9BACT|nr:MAG: hypothetical protein CDV28_1576 [Candidatus Electronema aureum]
MKKYFMPIICSIALWHGICAAEIKKVAIPDVQMNPSINSVLNQKNSVLKQNTAESRESSVVPETNGYLLPEGNIIVDNPIEPKCIFYGNYNEGSGDSFQYIDVNTIVFECQ